MTFDIKRLQLIVHEAGKIIRSAKVTGENVDRKQGDANFVTEEETLGNQAGRLSDGFTFIIDPIDGTTNFVFDCRYSCISVAVAWSSALVAG